MTRQSRAGKEGSLEHVDSPCALKDGQDLLRQGGRLINAQEMRQCQCQRGD